MGKTQSKRSVDITTESKKSPEEEVTGKLEKIEDLDQKQVNGDASPQENAETERKDGDETENDKDLTTEKSVGENGAQDGGGDTNTGQSSASTVETAAKEDESSPPKDGEKSVEEISPLADENNKKPKKEKVKKKWSFRSISFGKKDKQKPAKTEDAANENAAATNGDGAAPAGEETTDKRDETAGDAEAKTTNQKPAENGTATEKEMNGEKTSTPTTPTEEQQPSKEIATNETTTNITNNTTETTSSVKTENKTTTATENNQTEKPTITTTTKLAVETTESLTAIVSNGDAIEKNGTEMLSSTADEQNDHQVTDKATKLIAEASSDASKKIKSIPKVANDVVVADNNGVHQNGTSAANGGEELENEIGSKSQVEVIFQTEQAAHTDDLVTLTATATTSSSPKQTPILFPDPNNTDAIKLENENSISKCLISDTNEEATTKGAENVTANIVEDVALKEIEPVSTSISSAVEVVNVDTGHDEPSEPESYEIEKNTNHQTLTEKPIEDIGEVSSGAVNEITAAHEVSPKPPPLPVSPPPSQVSVFAFNDNNQAVEEEQASICSPTHSDIANSETSQPSKSADLLTDCTNDKELSNKADATCDLPSPTIDSETDEPAQIIDSMPTETPENSVAPQMQEENLFNIENTLPKLSDSIDENTQDELVKTATAVVNEISEKAVELIQQQSQLGLQQPQIQETNDDLKTDNTAAEMDNHIEDVEASSDMQNNSTDDAVIKVLESLNLNSEDKSVLKNETLLNELESHLIDCIKATDKHNVIVDGENEITTTDICSQSVVSVNDDDEHQN